MSWPQRTWLEIAPLILLLLSGFSAAQTQAPESDLDAAAKLARERREHEKAKRSDRSDVVNQMAKELSESDEEPIAGAPTGYRYYYFKPGDYAILVPADAKPEARDNYGLHLFSQEAFTSRIAVILGEPIPANGKTPEEMIHNANAEYFAGCAFNISGLGPPVNGHPAHSAGFGNCPLNHEILGYAEFVLGDDYVMPVICGYPMTAQDWDPSPNQPIQRIVKKYDRERRGYEVCKLVLDSLKFQPLAGRWQPKIAPAEKQPTATTALLTTQNSQASETGETSLGQLARAHRKTPSANVLTDLRHASAGYTPLNFRYFCEKDNSVCYSASIDLPTNAKQNDQYANPWTGLFQYIIPVAGGRSMAILQANTGVPSEPGIISREEFIRTKIDWWMGYFPSEYYSRVGQGQVLSEELTEVGDVPTRFATFRNTTGSGSVITQLAAYMIPGKLVHIRCSVAEEFSGDAQAVCQHILNSLEVPRAEAEDRDDPPANDPSPDDNDPE